MTTQTAPPWSATPALLRHKDGAWQQVDEKTLAGEHASASLMLVLGRIAGLRPPFGRSVFTDVLQRTPGTVLSGETITPQPQEAADPGTRSLESAERLLAASLARYGARGAVQSALPVDHMITRYLSDITSRQPESSPQSEQRKNATAVVDARGVRDLIGAVEEEREAADSSPYPAFLQRLLKRDRSHSSQPGPVPADAPEASPDSAESTDSAGTAPEAAEPELDLDPQWLAGEAIQMIDVARIVSLTSWQEAVKDLPPRTSQLLWTAAEDPATSALAPYRPAHDPQVLAAFAQVPATQRAITLPNGLRTLDAALCQRYGRDPVGDHAAARLQAVREASQAWQRWEEELAQGSLAARGLIDTDGMRRIGQDPFLRQKYALSIKKTVETERWVTSWLEAGGSLTE
ncbi:actinodefensin-associated protein A [Actinomyces wuliandei]|uniref:actinodefensin-associated protein A n=1 Tax=Actinomyces wuliandei TaxID=2057743 RepID=UPI00111B3B63|nr:actinodefensin-associated protein A [Actinomyces wuliandei]